MHLVNFYYKYLKVHESISEEKLSICSSWQKFNILLRNTLERPKQLFEILITRRKCDYLGSRSLMVIGTVWSFLRGVGWGGKGLRNLCWCTFRFLKKKETQRNFRKQEAFEWIGIKEFRNEQASRDATARAPLHRSLGKPPCLGPGTDAEGPLAVKWAWHNWDGSSRVFPWTQCAVLWS